MRMHALALNPIRHYLATIALCMLVAGCSVGVPLPNPPAAILHSPKTLHVVKQRPGEPDHDAILVARSEGDRTYWALFDALGVPLARQILQDGKWQNDGFLPPNPDARALFAGLIFAWTPTTQLTARYPAHNITHEGDTRILGNGDKALVTVTTTAAHHLQLLLDNGTRWQVMPLEETHE